MSRGCGRSWLHPDAPTSADRLFCHVYGRGGRSSDQFIPGWPYAFVVALETSRTSWCQLLDVAPRRQRHPGRLRRRLRRPAHGPLPVRAAHGDPRLDAARERHPHLPCPARVPKPSTPGLRRPLGSTNKMSACAKPPLNHCPREENQRRAEPPSTTAVVRAGGRARPSVAGREHRR